MLNAEDLNYYLNYLTGAAEGAKRTLYNTSNLYRSSEECGRLRAYLEAAWVLKDLMSKEGEDTINE